MGSTPAPRTILQRVSGDAITDDGALLAAFEFTSGRRAKPCRSESFRVSAPASSLHDPVAPRRGEVISCPVAQAAP